MSDTPKGMMEVGLFQSVVDQAADHLPVTLVPFFRGESLLHPHLVQMLSYARIKGLQPIQLATNGSLLDREVGRRLLDLGLDFISFSLDTIDAEEYSRIRGNGHLDQVIRNILRFIELRDKGGYRTEVQVSATRTELNRASIDDFVDFWREKADRTRVYYEHSCDGNLGSLDCLEVPRQMERKPCRKVFSDMVVYFDGTVAACNHDWFRTPPLGDLRRQSVIQVWRGQPYHDLRTQHLNPETLSDQTCLTCDHWKINYLEDKIIGELYVPALEHRHA